MFGYCAGPGGGNVPAVYALDSTDVSRWEECVSRPAVSILTALQRVGINWNKCCSRSYSRTCSRSGFKVKYSIKNTQALEHLQRNRNLAVVLLSFRISQVTNM